MTSTRQELDPKVVHWAADTLAIPFPFQDAYIGNVNVNGSGNFNGGHRIDERRAQIRGLLQSGGLSGLACLSKKELRLLYDGVSSLLPKVRMSSPLKRSALKGQIVEQLSVLLTDPTVVQGIQSRPVSQQGKGHAHWNGTAPTVTPPVPGPPSTLTLTSTQVPTGTPPTTTTMHHQRPYPCPYPYPFLSPGFPMPMSMMASLPAHSPTPPLSSRSSPARKTTSAPTPLERQLPISPSSLSRKRKTPYILAPLSPPPSPPSSPPPTHPTQASTNIPALQSAFSPPIRTNGNLSSSGAFPRPATAPPQPSNNANPPRLSNDNESLDSTEDSTDDPTDLLWIHHLRVCGFQDEREIRQVLQARRRQQPQQQLLPVDPITLEGLICDIITAREESALARDMDEARRQSEIEHQQEQQRLANQRADETQQRLLKASLHELLHPPPQSSKLFFPRSWLLRHPPLQSLLQDITIHHMDIKKELIPLLQLEKNSFRWYANGISKSYYTHHLTKVLLGDLDLSLLPTKLQDICHQINEGHALRSKQNSSGIPLLYIQAQQEYAKLEKDQDQTQDHPPEDNDKGPAADDDDDDEVQILDEEQIQKLKEKVRSHNPTAAIDVDGDVADPLDD